MARLGAVVLKGCKRCHGDVRLTQDILGAYWSCLQCGREAFTPPVAQQVKEEQRLGSRRLLPGGRHSPGQVGLNA